MTVHRKIERTVENGQPACNLSAFIADSAAKVHNMALYVRCMSANYHARKLVTP